MKTFQFSTQILNARRTLNVLLMIKLNNRIKKLVVKDLKDL